MAIIMDDNGSQDDLYGYATLTIYPNGDGTYFVDAYAYDYLINYGPNMGWYAALLDARLSCDGQVKDESVTYYEGGFGGCDTVEWYALASQGQEIYFSVGYGVINSGDYLYWYDCVFSNLNLTVGD